MAQKYEVDDTGEIEQFCIKVRKKYIELKDKENLNFLYAWRSELKLEGPRIIRGSVSKLPSRDRDLYGLDVRVEICAQSWEQMSNKEKAKLCYHELSHIEIEYPEVIDELSEEDKKPKTDNEGRVCFRLEHHNIFIGRFKAELKKFGLSEEEDALRKFLNKVNKKFKK